MSGWTVTFATVALFAALLGFGELAGAASGIAKAFFLVFSAAAVASAARWAAG